MKQVFTLSLIGILAGIMLALFLKIIQILTGNQAYDLLFQVDYIPLLKSLHPVVITEVVFHFGTCILSVVFLYYILRFFRWEKKISSYTIVILIGSSLLFFLTMLSSHTPEITDLFAWGYWVIGHGIFSIIVGLLVKRWIE